MITCTDDYIRYLYDTYREQDEEIEKEKLNEVYKDEGR